MIWYAPYTIEQLNLFINNTLLEQLQITFTEIGDNYLKAKMPVNNRTHQPYGLLHGGASCALAETVASTAANCCINPAKNICVGIEINANHVRSVRTGYVSAITKPVHIGSKTQVWNIEIYDSHDALICIARHTIAVLIKDYFNSK